MNNSLTELNIELGKMRKKSLVKSKAGQCNIRTEKD
jgi:hypothetical protein